MPDVQAGSPVVLVVEDEAALCDLIAEILSSGGFTVLTARNGEEALQVAADHSGELQLLISDVVMPRMSGTELATRFLQARPKLKVLLMSGYTTVPDAPAGTFYIDKPFTPDKLLKRVRGILSGKASA